MPIFVTYVKQRLLSTSCNQLHKLLWRSVVPKESTQREMYLDKCYHSALADNNSIDPCGRIRSWRIRGIWLKLETLCMIWDKTLGLLKIFCISCDHTRRNDKSGDSPRGVWICVRNGCCILKCLLHISIILHVLHTQSDSKLRKFGELFQEPTISYQVQRNCS